MRLRSYQIVRIIIASLIIIILGVLIIDESNKFRDFIIPPVWRFFLIALGLLLVIFLFLVFRLMYIEPVKDISQTIKEPEELLKHFIKKKYLPHEIRILYKAVLDYTQKQQANLDRYHADRVLFSSILQTMSDGILIVNENGIISMLNQAAAAMFKVEKDRVVSLSIAEGLRNHRLNELLLKCVATKRQESTSIENPLDKTYIHCIATPLYPELPENYLFLFQDLTRLHQLEIVRRDFISNVSHELRTPLASLKLITETLQEGAINDPHAAKKFINCMDGEVDNLSQMVEELLELSKIESGRVPLDKRWVNPAEIAQGSADRMALQAERAGVLLLKMFNGDLPVFYVDAPRLEQVLVNLLHNAIKFTPPGGQVAVLVNQDGNDIIFSIKDTGIGIPPKDLERIFERFYKADPSRSKRGTGLGLSISRHLVEIHNGKIWAESQPGEGSTFSFRIPIQ